jgi:uncharacterized protein YeaO (DUF488 family)
LRRRFAVVKTGHKSAHTLETFKVIKLKRVYDGEARDDGVRYLIERLWPRGVKKTSLHLDGWLKEAGPSTELRTWFHHDPAKWREFRRRYFAELDRAPENWATIRDAARRGTVTLLYSSHDTEHNNAVALKEYIEDRRRKPGSRLTRTGRIEPGKMTTKVSLKSKRIA